MTKTLTIALAVAISAAIFLTGCSATVVGVGSREALVADMRVCRQGDSHAWGYGSGGWFDLSMQLVEQADNDARFNQCMATRGWTDLGRNKWTRADGRLTSPLNLPMVSEPITPRRPPATPPRKNPLQLHFCDLGMYWDEATGQCVKKD